jgi:hypothetical protein
MLYAAATVPEDHLVIYGKNWSGKDVRPAEIPFSAGGHDYTMTLGPEAWNSPYGYWSEGHLPLQTNGAYASGLNSPKATITSTDPALPVITQLQNGAVRIHGSTIYEACMTFDGSGYLAYSSSTGWVVVDQALYDSCVHNATTSPG